MSMCPLFHNFLKQGMHFYKTGCEHHGTRSHLTYVLFDFLPLVIVTWLRNLWMRATVVLHDVGL
jgi:hypothetical protein